MFTPVLARLARARLAAASAAAGARSRLPRRRPDRRARSPIWRLLPTAARLGRRPARDLAAGRGRRRGRALDALPRRAHRALPASDRDLPGRARHRRGCRRTCTSARSSPRQVVARAPRPRARAAGPSRVPAPAGLARVRPSPAVPLPATARDAAAAASSPRFPWARRRRRCSAPGARAAPATRSSTPACASSGTRARCTTACA